jgi:hypothetical protein
MAVPLFNLCRGYPAHANPVRIGGSGSVQAEVWTGQVVQVFANHYVSVIIVAGNLF